MGTVTMEAFWMLTEAGEPFSVLATYNGRDWGTIGQGNRVLGKDLFSTKAEAERAWAEMVAPSTEETKWTCSDCGLPFLGGLLALLCPECVAKPENLLETMQRIIKGTQSIESSLNRGDIGKARLYVEGVHDNAQEVLDALTDANKHMTVKNEKEGKE